MRPFPLKTSPILTMTYTGCNMEMRADMYGRALRQVSGAMAAAVMAVSGEV